MCTSSCLPGLVFRWWRCTEQEEAKEESCGVSPAQDYSMKAAAIKNARCGCCMLIFRLLVQSSSDSQTLFRLFRCTSRVYENFRSLSLLV